MNEQMQTIEGRNSSTLKTTPHIEGGANSLRNDTRWSVEKFLTLGLIVAAPTIMGADSQGCTSTRPTIRPGYGEPPTYVGAPRPWIDPNKICFVLSDPPGDGSNGIEWATCVGQCTTASSSPEIKGGCALPEAFAEELGIPPDLQWRARDCFYWWMKNYTCSFSEVGIYLHFGDAVDDGQCDGDLYDPVHWQSPACFQ